MLTIKFIRWLYKTLNGVERPWQIALGLALGFAFGMAPFGVVTLAGLLLMLFINCHFGSALFGLALGLALGPPLLTPALGVPIGMAVIESGPHELFKTLAAEDGLALFRLHQSGTIGGLALGLMLGVPVFIVARIGVIRFREPLHSKIGGNKAFKTISNMAFWRALRWVFVG